YPIGPLFVIVLPVSGGTCLLVILKFSGCVKHLPLSIRHRWPGLVQGSLLPSLHVISLQSLAPKLDANLSRLDFMNCMLSRNLSNPSLNAIYFSILYGLARYHLDISLPNTFYYYVTIIA